METRMAALICGSLAFDTITNFPGRFAQQILPEQVHILNVSFLVPSLRREFGGCAGNIAYNLHLIGGDAVVLAALGEDGATYGERLRSWGADTSLVCMVPGCYTAQAMIITDQDNNQITAFHPGAMQQAHGTRVPEGRSDLCIGIVAPDGRDAMIEHAEQMQSAGIDFVFDPGQGLPMFEATELRCQCRPSSVSMASSGTSCGSGNSQGTKPLAVAHAHRHRPRLQRRQRAVVEAAAVAQPHARGPEAHAGHQQQLRARRPRCPWAWGCRRRLLPSGSPGTRRGSAAASSRGRSPAARCAARRRLRSSGTAPAARRTRP
jgi:hypothetical protein